MQDTRTSPLLAFVALVLVVACGHPPASQAETKPIGSETHTALNLPAQPVAPGNPTVAQDHLPGVQPVKSLDQHCDANPGGNQITSNDQRVDHRTSRFPRARKTNAATPTPVVTRGDIVARTMEGSYALLKPDGTERPIDQRTFAARWRDPALAPDGTFRLVVAGWDVLHQSTDGRSAPGTVAKTGKGHAFDQGLVAVDSFGLYGAVIQNHRDIFLFEAQNAHHQGVIFTVPESVTAIEKLVWGVGPHSDDLLLLLRDRNGMTGVFWLRPAAHHQPPQHVRAACFNALHRLTDCMMRHNRKMEKQLMLIRDHVLDASVVW